MKIIKTILHNKMEEECLVPTI